MKIIYTYKKDNFIYKKLKCEEKMFVIKITL